MKSSFLAIVLMAVSNSAFAAVINIDALDVRSTGVFGHPDVSAVTINGVAPTNNTTANPINVSITYSNLDLDGDASANDAVTFTLTATGSGASPRIFGQGIDTGFGSLIGVTVSVSSVTGTTTDSGDTIVFDGFTGANIGAGSGSNPNAGTGNPGSPAVIDRSVEINGSAVSIVFDNTPTPGFVFQTNGIDFAPTPTVLFDNSSGTSGSLVARSYDLQFSTVPVPVPEPSSVALIGLVGGFCGLSRRKRAR